MAYQNQIFIILALLLRRMSRVTGPIFAAQRLLGNTAPKKCRSVGDTVSDLTGLGIEPPTFRTHNDVFTHYTPTVHDLQKLRILSRLHRNKPVKTDLVFPKTQEKTIELLEAAIDYECLIRIFGIVGVLLGRSYHRCC